MKPLSYVRLTDSTVAVKWSHRGAPPSFGRGSGRHGPRRSRSGDTAHARSVRRPRRFGHAGARGRRHVGRCAPRGARFCLRDAGRRVVSGGGRSVPGRRRPGRAPRWTAPPIRGRHLRPGGVGCPAWDCRRDAGVGRDEPSALRGGCARAGIAGANHRNELVASRPVAFGPCGRAARAGREHRRSGGYGLGVAPRPAAPCRHRGVGRWMDRCRIHQVSRANGPGPGQRPQRPGAGGLVAASGALVRGNGTRSPAIAMPVLRAHVSGGTGPGDSLFRMWTIIACRTSPSGRGELRSGRLLRDRFGRTHIDAALRWVIQLRRRAKTRNSLAPRSVDLPACACAPMWMCSGRWEGRSPTSGSLRCSSTFGRLRRRSDESASRPRCRYRRDRADPTRSVLHHGASERLVRYGGGGGGRLRRVRGCATLWHRWQERPEAPPRAPCGCCA